MKKILTLLWFCTLMSGLGYGYNGCNFVIGSVSNQPFKDKDEPIEICCHHTHNIFYPSRVIDIERRDKNMMMYNLHVVCSDSSSVQQIKTVKVQIPKGFEFFGCQVSSQEFLFRFATKKSEIIVIVPTLLDCDIEPSLHNVLYSSPLTDPLLDELKDYSVRNKELHENYYVGVIMNKDYYIYYYNFKEKQKVFFEKSYESLLCQ